MLKLAPTAGGLGKLLYWVHINGCKSLLSSHIIKEPLIANGLNCPADPGKYTVCKLPTIACLLSMYFPGISVPILFALGNCDNALPVGV